MDRGKPTMELTQQLMCHQRSLGTHSQIRSTGFPRTACPRPVCLGTDPELL